MYLRVWIILRSNLGRDFNHLLKCYSDITTIVPHMARFVDSSIEESNNRNILRNIFFFYRHYFPQLIR